MQVDTHTDDTDPKVVASVKFDPWPFAQDLILNSPCYLVNATGQIRRGETPNDSESIESRYSWLVELDNGVYVNGPNRWDGIVLWVDS